MNRQKETPESNSPDKPFVTAGERVHNEVTYRLIDWIVNSSIGVGFAYWSVKTKSGQELFARPVSNFFKSMLRPLLKSEQSLEEGARWGSMFTSIIVGGTTIIPPMMVLENNHVKRKIISWLDRKWYGKEAVEEDPKFEEAYQRIENEPKQGFMVGMAARLAVLAPMIAVTVIPTTNNFMIKYLYEPIAKGSKLIAHGVGIKPGRMLEQGSHVHPDGNVNLPKRFQSNWDFLHTTIGFDLGLTFIYSFCHETAYKTMAALFGEKEIKPATLENAFETPLPLAEAAAAECQPCKRMRQFEHRAATKSHSQFSDYVKSNAEGVQPTL